MAGSPLVPLHSSGGARRVVGQSEFVGGDPTLATMPEAPGGERPHAWNCIHYTLVQCSALRLTHSTRARLTPAWRPAHGPGPRAEEPP